jgi:RimJ/RimL family protein N-acetyltransferase
MREPANPIQYGRTVRLKDSTPVLIRPVRRDDRERVIRAFRELEPESIYTRFFSPRKELSEADLARIQASDFVHSLTLVGTVGQGDEEVIIGIGEYVVADLPGQPLTAEVSFIVEEDYHRLGMAGQLMAMLAELARGHGILRFEAEVLAGNAAMLRVFQRSGLPMRRRLDRGVVLVTMDIPTAEPASRSA